MKRDCHHCGCLAELSAYWEKKPDGSQDLKLICERCAAIYCYKFTASVLGKK